MIKVCSTTLSLNANSYHSETVPVKVVGPRFNRLYTNLQTEKTVEIDWTAEPP